MALCRAAVTALVASCIAAGCGGNSSSDERRAQLRLPPAPTATSTPRERTQAERVTPVIEAWAKAVRAGDFEAAAKFFALPAVVSQGVPLELTTSDQAETFNSGFPCGARVETVRQDGRFVVATFALTERPGAECTDVGERVRVAFVFRGRRFSEWYQVPDGAGPPGPRRRPEAGGERTQS
jgi:hypothetical protein